MASSKADPRGIYRAFYELRTPEFMTEVVVEETGELTQQYLSGSVKVCCQWDKRLVEERARSLLKVMYGRAFTNDECVIVDIETIEPAYKGHV